MKFSIKQVMVSMMLYASLSGAEVTVQKEKDAAVKSLEEMLSENIVTNAAATNLYAKHSIFLNPKGSLKSDFRVVNEFATDYELISKLAECLADSDVSVRKQDDGSYIYLNKKSKGSSKLWVLYDHSATNQFAGLYYFTGKKAFFNFKTLLYLNSTPKEDGSISFDGKIYADTDSAIANIASKIWFVRNFILGESNELISQFDTIYSQMMENPEENLKRIMQFRDPKGKIYFSGKDIEKLNRFYESLKKD